MASGGLRVRFLDGRTVRTSPDTQIEDLRAQLEAEVPLYHGIKLAVGHEELRGGGEHWRGQGFLRAWRCRPWS